MRTAKDDGELLPPGLALPDILSRREGKPRLRSVKREALATVPLVEAVRQQWPCAVAHT